VVQGNAYSLRHTLGNALSARAAAVVSGLPLMTKPMITRLRLITDAFAVMEQGGPFVQFTYAMMPPIPKDFSGVSAEPSELVWMNLPPARVWVYRHR
jgi:phosphatidylethanolamine/phosphatidyl-N-methylethanolamine N-methyltransferase